MVIYYAQWAQNTIRIITKVAMIIFVQYAQWAAMQKSRKAAFIFPIFGSYYAQVQQYQGFKDVYIINMSTNLRIRFI